MAESGLSFDQGPPFGAPLRYFLVTLGYLAMVMLGAFLSAPIDRYASIAGHLLLVASAIRQWLYLLQAKHLFLKHGGYLDLPNHFSHLPTTTCPKSRHLEKLATRVVLVFPFF